MKKKSHPTDGGRRPYRRTAAKKVTLRKKAGHGTHTLHKSPITFMQTRSPQDIETSTEKLLQDLKAVVQDGEDLLRAGAADLGERGAAVRERLEAALEMARDTKEKLQARATKGAKATDKLIRANPYQAVGIAFGVGMLLGVLANRR